MKALTKIIAILAVGITFFILLIFLAVSPMLFEVTSINSEVREKKLELAVLQQQIRAFKNAQSDLAKATRKDDLLNAIPIKEDLVLSVLDLEKAVVNTTSEQILDLKETNPKDKKQTAVISKKSGVEEVFYELSVRNDFAGLVNFLSYLEHLPHFTEISNFSLTSERTGSETDTSGRTGAVSGDFKGVFFIKTQK